MTDEEPGLIRKLLGKAGNGSRPSFSGRDMAQDAWEELNKVVEALVNGLKSIWRETA